MNNMYMFLNYLMIRQIQRKERKMTLFVDLKVAFNSMNKEVLVKTMREKGEKVWKRGVKRMIINRVRIGEKKEKSSEWERE